MTFTNAIETKSISTSKLTVAFVAMVSALLIVMGGAANAAPTTGFPTKVAQCEGVAWKDFKRPNNNGERFTSAADCKSFVVDRQAGTAYNGGNQNNNTVNNTPRIELIVQNVSNSVVNFTVNVYNNITNVFN